MRVKTYLITTWMDGMVFLHEDIQFDGVEIVLGKYEGNKEEEAKESASKDFSIPKDELSAVLLT